LEPVTGPHQLQLPVHLFWFLVVVVLVELESVEVVVPENFMK
jgi:hypothetical protein